jgi:hypothetical protein
MSSYFIQIMLKCVETWICQIPYCGTYIYTIIINLFDFKKKKKKKAKKIGKKSEKKLSPAVNGYKLSRLGDFLLLLPAVIGDDFAAAER